MKAFVNVLSAELLKLKRTNALRMVLIAPLAVIGLVTFLVGNVTTFYTVKLFIVAVMTLLSMTILACGIVAAGLILPKVQHDLHFAPVIPIRQIIQKAAEVFGLAFLFLSIQHWVSLRWRSFTVSVSFGMVGMVIGYGMLFTARGGSPGFAIYCPWSFPMMALVNPPANVTPLLWISLGLGMAWSVAGCWDFSRRGVE